MPAYMTDEQFSVIAKLLRASPQTTAAARLVLVQSKTNSWAARKEGLQPQSVSNTVTRFRIAFLAIEQAFCPKTDTVESNSELRT